MVKIMKDENKLKKISFFILRTLVVVFVPNISPLHLVSYKTGIEESQRKRSLSKYKKKMIRILDKFPQSEIYPRQELDTIQLFYQVYNHIDELTVKELKVLSNFCYLLDNKYDLRISESGEEESEQDIYYHYSYKIDKFLENRLLKK